MTQGFQCDAIIMLLVSLPSKSVLRDVNVLALTCGQGPGSLTGTMSRGY